MMNELTNLWIKKPPTSAATSPIVKHKAIQNGQFLSSVWEIEQAVSQPSSLTSSASEALSSGQDFSQMEVSSKPSAVRSDGVPTKSLTPTHCPFGGVCHTCPVKVQAKLAISQPGDEFEQEADRVAEMVMQMAKPEEKEGCHKTDCGGTLKRQVTEAGAPVQAPVIVRNEGELNLHRKTLDGANPMPALPSIVQDAIWSPGEPLDASARAFFEPRFGLDFSSVRVHSNTYAAEGAQALNAHAYTLGNDIIFNTGRYSPETRTGQQLIAH